MTNIHDVQSLLHFHPQENERLQQNQPSNKVTHAHPLINVTPQKPQTVHTFEIPHLQTPIHYANKHTTTTNITQHIQHGIQDFLIKHLQLLITKTPLTRTNSHYTKKTQIHPTVYQSFLDYRHNTYTKYFIRKKHPQKTFFQNYIYIQTTSKSAYHWHTMS